MEGEDAQREGCGDPGSCQWAWPRQMRGGGAAP